MTEPEWTLTEATVDAHPVLTIETKDPEECTDVELAAIHIALWKVAKAIYRDVDEPPEQIAKSADEQIEVYDPTRARNVD